MHATTGRGAMITAIAVVAASTFGFSLTAWRSARTLNILWDEQVDLDTAIALRDAPIRGESAPLDASQTRLPMYVTAIVFRLTGRADLDVARGASVAAAALGLVVTAMLAWRLFDAAVGALTAVLLALSPYYLAYGRIAMTEGDAFLALTIPTAVWLFLRFLERPTGPRWFAASVALGLALAAKAHAVVLVAVFAIALRSAYRRGAGASTDGSLAIRPLAIALASAGGVAIITLVAGCMHSPLVVVGWYILAAGLAIVGILSRRAQFSSAPPAIRLAMLVALAGITWFVVAPEHLTRPEIVKELVRRTLCWDDRIPLALWHQHLRLYAGIVLIKATVPVGLLTAAALVYGAVVEARDPRWRLPSLTIILWIVALCFLPLRQSFYLMGVYPFVMLATAAFMTQVARRIGRRRRIWRLAAWLAVVIAPIGWLGSATIRGYPDFEVFGYETVGDRWLGAESRGYRNLIQTNSHGVEELARWCAAHVPAGAMVASFVWEDHILERFLPAEPRFRFRSRGISQSSDHVPPPPGISDADFVLVHVNNLLGYGDRPPDAPPDAILSAEFRPVYIVRRGRSGIPVAWAYQRVIGGPAVSSPRLGGDAVPKKPRIP
ncbi:MAG: glycosyltransferase family 39 protein [Phycisphaerae bacterium]|nr:glycosyltransferase family 39 protein [Phycisphaerae bacterium]